MATFSDWLMGRGLAANTIRARVKFYESRMAAWGTWDLTASDLAKYLAAYVGWSRRTYHNHLISIYDWLVESGQAVVNPARQIRSAPSPKPRPRPLSADELTRAMDAATPGTRDFILLGCLAGLRAHEIAKIRGEDVTSNGIYVVGKGGQGHMIPVHPVLWEMAQRYPKRGWWFPSSRSDSGHICSETVTNAVGRLYRSLGLDGSSHRNRHSYGSRLLRNGANLRIVQDLMRHQSLATTALYLGVDEDEKVAAILKLAA